MTLKSVNGLINLANTHKIIAIFYNNNNNRYNHYANVSFDFDDFSKQGCIIL